jgi:hypothetical protein
MGVAIALPIQQLEPGHCFRCKNESLGYDLSTMNDKVPPRIYCIPATKAPVVAVFRRGPTNWSQVGRWDLDEKCYEPGAWLAGRIFPRRSDLSPDGRFLCYFAHKPNADWEHGEAYVAISKLPWLTALHAFGTCGTWTRGYYFSEDRSDIPEHTRRPIPYGLRTLPVVQFAGERLREWVEAPGCPARDPRDAWDERRNAWMQKRQPGGKYCLHVESLGWAGGEFGVGQSIDGMRIRYWLEANGDIELLDDLQWADWDRQGQLLAATRCGKIQIRHLHRNSFETVFEEDLSDHAPNPAPSPAWAQSW